jgi:hypothetical protein
MPGMSQYTISIFVLTLDFECILSVSLLPLRYNIKDHFSNFYIRQFLTNRNGVNSRHSVS